MSAEETWTIGRLLEWTTRFLKERGAESPRLDAEVLLAHARGCSRISLYAEFGAEPEEEVRDRFRELVKARSRGVPVAYLVEHREFFSLPFKVTPAVLIPRPETEFIVVRVLDLVKADPKLGQHCRIVDVGTGSGILAVTCAKQLPHAQVVAVDVSSEALQIARENAEFHQVSDRIEFVQNDLLDGIDGAESFDFVISNPPYVSESEFAELSTEVRDQEPRIALVAGEFGTEVIERLLPQAVEKLRVGGYLLVEISPMICQRASELFTPFDSLQPPEVHHDLARLPRILESRRRS